MEDKIIASVHNQILTKKDLGELINAVNNHPNNSDTVSHSEAFTILSHSPEVKPQKCRCLSCQWLAEARRVVGLEFKTIIKKGVK